MPKFLFRLQRLLELRNLRASWARDAYLSARARRLEAEEAAQQIVDNKLTLLHSATLDLPAKRALEATLNRLDDEFRAQQAAVSVLEQEENHLHDQWVAAKREAEAIDKLREHAREEWKVDEERRTQAEMDDWAVTRRAT